MEISHLRAQAQEKSADRMLDLALSYAEDGLRVFPLEVRGKKPLGPLAPNGCHAATTDPETIRKWWEQVPEANIGIATGSGIVVLDIDGDSGVASFDALPSLPLTHSVTTGKGQHLYFKTTASTKNTAGKLGAGLDTRGDGGYVVAPGSIHPSGRIYTAQGRVADAADAPDWLIEKITKEPADRVEVPARSISAADRHYAAVALMGECAKVSAATSGNRNDQLNKSAFRLGQLVAGGLLACDEVISELSSSALRCGLHHAEIKATLNSGLNGGKQHPRSRPAENDWEYNWNGTPNGHAANGGDSDDGFDLEIKRLSKLKTKDYERERERRPKGLGSESLLSIHSSGMSARRIEYKAVLWSSRSRSLGMRQLTGQSS